MAQYNFLNLPQIEQQAQAVRAREQAMGRANVNAQREDQAYSRQEQQYTEAQKYQSLARMHAAVRVINEQFAAGKPDLAMAAADEIAPWLAQNGDYDMSAFDPANITPESMQEAETRLSAALQQFKPMQQTNAAVGKTWINPETGTMWGMTRTGQPFDTGVPAQQYALRPVETSEGKVPFDPSRGGQVGEPIPGTDPASMREVAAADAESKAEVERVANLRKTAPAAHKSVSYAVTTMDRFIDQAKRLRAHEGLSMATGFGGEELSGVAGTPAADAAALANTLKSQSFITALGAMREASKTGGAVGNVSDAEGGRFENAFVSLMQSQSYPQFVSELNRLISIAEESKTMLGSAYLNEYKGIDNAPQLQLRSPETEDGILQMARDAIAKGKDPIAVKRMLQDVYGIDPARL